MSNAMIFSTLFGTHIRRRVGCEVCVWQLADQNGGNTEKREKQHKREKVRRNLRVYEKEEKAGVKG
jgi:3'-phosphoadenosine 5'-phosphosulfate sulfotransferase (PAPS reductase)/FAD synthetase